MAAATSTLSSAAGLASETEKEVVCEHEHVEAVEVGGKVRCAPRDDDNDGKAPSKKNEAGAAAASEEMVEAGDEAQAGNVDEVGIGDEDGDDGSLHEGLGQRDPRHAGARFLRPPGPWGSPRWRMRFWSRNARSFIEGGPGAERKFLG